MTELDAEPQGILHRLREEAPALRLKSLPNLIPMEPTTYLERLSHVLAQVRRRYPRRRERARVPELSVDSPDLDETAIPCALDQSLVDVATDHEVCMEPVSAWMPLGHPYVSEPLAPGRPAQLPEETPHVCAERQLIVATRTPIGECRWPVEPIRGAVATYVPPSPPDRFRQSSVSCNLPGLPG